MNSFISLSLASLACAVSYEYVTPSTQNPLFTESCPRNSILLNGECQVSNTPNQISYENQTAQTLQESFEAAQKTEGIPWTFWPQCFANDNTTEPNCVFSDQDFASGRGIFLAMPSSRAYDIIKKPAFTELGALDRVNHHGSPPFVHQEFPGKGRGLVANKTLHRGDQIFASTPLLISHPNTYELTETERLALVHRGVSTLPKDSQNLFWGLLDHFKGDPVDDRINTNAFEIEINGHEMYAVFPEIAMTNHDCRPNAAYFWDEETLSHYVHATQTIYPGEEITITYINNEKSRAKRIANLERNWGFQCSCSSCSAHPELVAESDSRIKEIGRLADILDDWSLESEATPQMAELLISLYEQERLFASLGAAYKYAAEAYSSFGDRYNAIKYARLSAEHSLLDKGFRDTDVGAMKKMAEDPELSWSWGKRLASNKKSGCGCGHSH